MKKNLRTPLVDEYLQSLENIRGAETDPFFYTRLKARMERKTGNEPATALQPVWLVSLLTLFLFINSFFLITQTGRNKETTPQASSLQTFASGYDLSVSSPF